ncbi:WG repeat-containing protein [Micromonospora sp. NPDC047134]|uniref:WG repeat-containing protein n=1 Tax=Micromonospora sp. NPDC047134 TaxID=3154340 RepID=UPI0033F54902
MSRGYDRWGDPPEPSWMVEPTTEWQPQFPGQRYPGDDGADHHQPRPRGRASAIGRAEVPPLAPTRPDGTYVGRSWEDEPEGWPGRQEAAGHRRPDGGNSPPAYDRFPHPGRPEERRSAPAEPVRGRDGVTWSDMGPQATGGTGAPTHRTPDRYAQPEGYPSRHDRRDRGGFTSHERRGPDRYSRGEPEPDRRQADRREPDRYPQHEPQWRDQDPDRYPRRPARPEPPDRDQYRRGAPVSPAGPPERGWVPEPGQEGQRPAAYRPAEEVDRRSGDPARRPRYQWSSHPGHPGHEDEPRVEGYREQFGVGDPEAAPYPDGYLDDEPVRGPRDEWTRAPERSRTEPISRDPQRHPEPPRRDLPWPEPGPMRPGTGRGHREYQRPVAPGPGDQPGRDDRRIPERPGPDRFMDRPAAQRPDADHPVSPAADHPSRRHLSVVPEQPVSPAPERTARPVSPAPEHPVSPAAGRARPVSPAPGQDRPDSFRPHPDRPSAPAPDWPGTPGPSSQRPGFPRPDQHQPSRPSQERPVASGSDRAAHGETVRPAPLHQHEVRPAPLHDHQVRPAPLHDQPMVATPPPVPTPTGASAPPATPPPTYRPVSTPPSHRPVSAPPVTPPSAQRPVSAPPVTPPSAQRPVSAPPSHWPLGGSRFEHLDAPVAAPTDDPPGSTPVSGPPVTPPPGRYVPETAASAGVNSPPEGPQAWFGSPAPSPAVARESTDLPGRPTQPVPPVSGPPATTPVSAPPASASAPLIPPLPASAPPSAPSVAATPPATSTSVAGLPTAATPATIPPATPDPTLPAIPDSTPPATREPAAPPPTAPPAGPSWLTARPGDAPEPSEAPEPERPSASEPTPLAATPVSAPPATWEQPSPPMAPVSGPPATATPQSVTPAATAPVSAPPAPPAAPIPSAPATEAPPAIDVPPAEVIPPADDVPATEDAPSAEDAPPAEDAPSADDVPAADIASAAEAAPADVVPPDDDALVAEASAADDATESTGDEEPEPPADPEQVLAGYRWQLDPEQLREVVEDPQELRTVRDRLTDKLASALDNRSRARLLSLRAVASRVLGDLDDALDDGRLALTYAEATGELRRVALAQARLAHVLRWRGEFAEADRLFAEADSVELPDRLRAALHEHAARCCYDQGRLMEACHHFERALDLRGEGDAELLARVRIGLDAVATRAALRGFGPYPRSADEVLDRERGPVPARDGDQGLWGYADGAGDLVVPARYAEAQPFSEGLAWVRGPESEHWSLIDLTGEVVVEPTYLAARPFSDGLAWVVRDNSGWLAVDTTGEVVVPPGFADVRPFRKGVAAVRREGWGAVDLTGQIVVPTRYHGFHTLLADGRYVDGFTDEGLAVVDLAGRKGVVDRTGQVIVTPAHPALLIHPVAFLATNGIGRWGALDRRGGPLIDPVFGNPNEVIAEIEALLTDTTPLL